MSLASGPANGPLLVGEANPYGSLPEYTLWPSPERSAGYRLCHNILGMTQHQYLTTFRRTNLCPTAWSMKAARERAAQLKSTERSLILLGAKVCEAFGFAYEPLANHERGYVEAWDTRILILPHPSGLCRYWNAPGAMDNARAAVESFLRATANFTSKEDV